MARAYSLDLRERVVGAVEQEGLSRRQAAARFWVGIKTAIDWVKRFRLSGSVAALPTRATGCSASPTRRLGSCGTG